MSLWAFDFEARTQLGSICDGAGLGFFSLFNLYVPVNKDLVVEPVIIKD